MAAEEGDGSPGRKPANRENLRGTTRIVAWDESSPTTDLATHLYTPALDSCTLGIVSCDTRTCWLLSRSCRRFFFLPPFLPPSSPVSLPPLREDKGWRAVR